MSRIGKLPVIIPEGTEVDITAGVLSAKGPKGELSYNFSQLLEVRKEDGKVIVSIKKETRESRMLFGLTRTLIDNVIQGVTKGFEKKLTIHGVGFNAQVKENIVVLNVGFSHPVEMKIPEGISVRVEKNTIIVEGISKEAVGQFAADIRKVKKPEPYKGKGIKYENERIIRKAGKTAK